MQVPAVDKRTHARARIHTHIHVHRFSQSDQRLKHSSRASRPTSNCCELSNFVTGETERQTDSDRDGDGDGGSKTEIETETETGIHRESTQSPTCAAESE